MDPFLNNCSFQELSKELIGECVSFTCEKNKDIEEFFLSEFADYESQLLGKSYCFVKEDASKKVVCAFTVANTSIVVGSLPNNRRNKINRTIPNQKRKSQYPAVLIGQLAVFDDFSGKRIGDELLDFIKSWFIDPMNKTGCRYLVVDAVNQTKVLDFYKRNGFEFVFQTDKDELKQMIRMTGRGATDTIRKTRLMFFDLIVLKS